MLCAKYNLQSERTFETPCISGNDQSVNVDIPTKSGACIKNRIDPELSRQTISAVTSNYSSVPWGLVF